MSVYKLEDRPKGFCRTEVSSARKEMKRLLERMEILKEIISSSRNRRECKKCCNEFFPRRKDAIFCSLKCRAYFSRGWDL